MSDLQKIEATLSVVCTRIGFEQGLTVADDDAADLDRQRRLLCIRKEDVRQVHRDTCGRIFAAVSP